ncbi:hypothetical protein ACROYT_G019429 [Oculina patagonica]
MAAIAWSLRGSSKIANIYSAISLETWNPVVVAAVCSPMRQQRRFMSKPLEGRTVRIGCASGFWGDSVLAAPQLVRDGDINYLVSDYLSEITMSLLTAAKRKSPTLGYAPDFIQAVMKPLIKPIKQKGIRVVSNAGGINPHECANALMAVAKESNTDLKVAVITGDDLMADAEEIRKSGIKDMGSGEDFPGNIVSMNAYLGALPIVRALELGADVVVTGRCTDSALALGPLMHEFGWRANDYDLLASGRIYYHHSTPLQSSPLQSLLHCSTLFYSTLLYFILLYSTPLYSTLPLLYSTRPYSKLYATTTVLYTTLLYSTSTRLNYYSTPPLLYSTLLDSTPPPLDWAGLDSTRLYSTIRYSTVLYTTLLYSTLLYATLLDSTPLYVILLYSTPPRLDSTRLVGP